MARKIPVLLLCLLPATLFAQNIYKSPDTTYFSPDTVPQKDVIDIIRSVFKISKEKPRAADPVEKKFYFSFLPVSKKRNTNSLRRT